MKIFLMRYWLVGALILAGLVGGFLYWKFVGCTSGSCPITSNWHSSSLMGGLIGYLTGDSVNDFLLKRKKS